MIMRLTLAAAMLAAMIPAAAAQGGRCTSETLNVRRVPVTLGYCVTGAAQSGPGGTVLVPVSGQYSAPSGSFSEAMTLRFVGGERTSRVIRSLDLSRVGSSGVLHLTLAYDGSTIRIESALLTPGAITIK